MSAPARIPPPLSVLASELDEENPQTSFRRRFAILAFLALAALLHLAVFENPWVKNLTWLSPIPAHRVEVQQVDPKKLEAIRRQWAREKEKSLFLSKNQPRSETAPEDSRYFSDRNLHVDQEQRARQAEVMPKPGSGHDEKAQQQQPQQQKPRAKPKPKPKSELPSLQSLGVPIPLTAKSRPDPGDDPPEDSPQNSKERKQTSAPSGPRGADQALLDRSLPEGSENLLNAQESVYYSFYARLYDAIGPLWQSRVNALAQSGFQIRAGEYSTLVDVVLDAEGNLVDVRLVQASGVPAFDRVVDESWHKVSRFPNPPKGLLDRNGQVHTGWTFTVSVGAGPGMQFLPPERNY